MGRFSSTPYLILFILLGAIGVGTAIASTMVTIAGNFTVTEDTFLRGNLDILGQATGPTFTDIFNQLGILNSTVMPLTNRMVSVPSGTGAAGCEVINECYIPFIILAKKGDTITWTNDDNVEHSVTSGTVSELPDGIFDSGLFLPNATFVFQFSQEGTFPYFCIIHPWQTGVVIVA